jgi:sigma-B regulation protein RsbU (phosphoserine phosphatase)
MSVSPSIADPTQRLTYIVEMMREISRQNDPQQVVQTYMKKIGKLIPTDATLSLSRRDLVYPYYHITRSSRWGKDAVNPWKSPEQLPLMHGGLLAELLYGDEPRIIDHLEVADDDPAIEYLRGHHSLLSIPLFDQGHALNMVIAMRSEPAAFEPDSLPERIWMSNLFGRATQTLVLSEQLREANEILERELQVVADIQHSLLPEKLPHIPTLELAVDYKTSRYAGGDYYDCFHLPDGRWGFLIADVAGHGTPAAVIMAVTHSIAHADRHPPEPPSRLISFLNQRLAANYTNGNGKFVTAFYGIYDPKNRTFTYANAGHNPPRHKRHGASVIGSLEAAINLPLGIEPDETYCDITQTLQVGDTLVLYTDGITEARRPHGELFSQERLDQVLLKTNGDAHHLLKSILNSVEDFTGGAAPNDDRTLLIAKVK